MSSTVTKSVPSCDGTATNPILRFADAGLMEVKVPLKAVTVTKCVVEFWI